MHIFDTVIAETSKGHRVWIQGLAAHGWNGGDTYTTQYTKDLIVYRKSTEGKVRKVTAAKGGIIDTVGKKVTQWAQGAQQVRVAVDSNEIIITRAQA